MILYFLFKNPFADEDEKQTFDYSKEQFEAMLSLTDFYSDDYIVKWAMNKWSWTEDKAKHVMYQVKKRKELEVI